jgi:hypothetical protein
MVIAAQDLKMVMKLEIEWSGDGEVEPSHYWRWTSADQCFVGVGPVPTNAQLEETIFFSK